MSGSEKRFSVFLNPTWPNDVYNSKHPQADCQPGGSPPSLPRVIHWDAGTTTYPALPAEGGWASRHFQMPTLRHPEVLPNYVAGEGPLTTDSSKREVIKRARVGGLGYFHHLLVCHGVSTPLVGVDDQVPAFPHPRSPTQPPPPPPTQPPLPAAALMSIIRNIPRQIVNRAAPHPLSRELSIGMLVQQLIQPYLRREGGPAAIFRCPHCVTPKYYQIMWQGKAP